MRKLVLRAALAAVTLAAGPSFAADARGVPPNMIGLMLTRPDSKARL